MLSASDVVEATVGLGDVASRRSTNATELSQQGKAVEAVKTGAKDVLVGS